MNVAVIPPGGGEVIGDAPDRRVEVLSDDDALNATWSRFAAGRAGADLHVHREHSDLFYVLEGELTVRLGPDGEEVAVPAGRLARVPPMVVHGFRNASDADVRYLNFHAPGRRFADYLRALRDGRELSYDQFDPPEDGGRPPTDAVIGAPYADVDEIAVAEVRLRPGGGTPRTIGVLSSAYVLEGEAALTVGGETVAAPAGTWLQVRPGLERTWSAQAPARLLVVHTPRR